METKLKTAAQTALDLERERQYCELCGKMENLLKCGRCRNSFYCSKEHQKQHWKMHKVNCKESEENPQVSKQKPAEPPVPSGGVKGQTPQLKTRVQPDNTASPRGETRMKGFITNAECAGSSLGKPGGSNTKPNGQTSTRSTPQNLAIEYIVPCMIKHGICVVDNFLGGETGQAILEDVKLLHKTGKFTDGQLVSQKTDSTKDIRGDKITWIEGREAGCEKICFLMSRMDDLVRHCNGQLGNFTINGRTKNKVLNIDAVKVKLQIWDTAGQERFRSVTHAYYRDAHALLLLYDVTNKASFDNIKAWLTEIHEYAQQDVVLMLLGNKADATHERVVKREEGEKLAKEFGVPFMETSAKSGLNVELAFTAVARELKHRSLKEPDEPKFQLEDYVNKEMKSAGCCRT